MFSETDQKYGQKNYMRWQKKNCWHNGLLYVGVEKLHTAAAASALPSSAGEPSPVAVLALFQNCRWWRDHQRTRRQLGLPLRCEGQPLGGDLCFRYWVEVCWPSDRHVKWPATVANSCGPLPTARSSLKQLPPLSGWPWRRHFLYNLFCTCKLSTYLQFN